jgi:hypothetical protein
MEREILSTFKKNIITFVDELIEQFPQETNLVIARIVIKDRIDENTLMNRFINTAIPFKEQINKRDENFFLKEEDVFSSFDNKKIIAFKSLWQSPNIDDEDKEIIWKWFDVLIFLCEKYISIKN